MIKIYTIWYQVVYNAAVGTRLTVNVTPPEPHMLCIRSHLLKNAYIHGNRFGILVTDQFDAFFKTKHASETNATNSILPNRKTYEFSRH